MEDKGTVVLMQLQRGRHRDRYTVVRDILKVIEAQPTNQQAIIRIANLTSPDWKRYRANLIDTGLMKSKVVGEAGRFEYSITEKGKAYLKQLSHIEQLIARP